MAAGESLTFTPAQRSALAEAVAGGHPVTCPVCEVPMARHPVGAKRELPYVRRRLLLICPRCRRSASIDVKSAGPPT